jgi:peptide deformylase
MSSYGYYAAVPRSRFLTLGYVDAEDKKQRLHTREWLARILRHEIDHLDGVLWLDRMIPRTLVMRVSFGAQWSRLPAGGVLQRFGASWESPTEHQE